MKNLRLIFILASLCTVGIVITQVYWVRRAYVFENKKFDLNVNIALRDVALKVWEYKQSQAAMYNVVTRVSSDYYFVKINEHVEQEILEHFLKESFTANDLYTDFVYGLHDCMNNDMEYKKFINLSNRTAHPTGFVDIPKTNIENYYFVVYFPTRKDYLASQLTFWMISSVFLVGVLLFMAYIVYVILNQKRLSQMQKDFVKNMTHEFKTPLASIQLASSVLKKPTIIENPSRLLNYATIIESEAKRLEMQVERVLQMSLGQKRELELNKRLVDIRPVITDVIATYQTKLENRNGMITIDLGNKELILNVDVEHLSIALSNLIDNAIKYTPEEVNPQITVVLKEQAKSISLTISDNGIGIERNSMKHIFERFYRVSTGNVHNVKGFGIGLNYVKAIIDLHEGKIICESESGKGASFTISLPKPELPQ
ncbi:two-component sensor histidine kinase [Taibaiella sp. KBW10]|uniref:sensor histidine kinase n=1 Tax=Taibaiella sp. KBW10 TaxID=2153357 RepID=UPI000F5AC10F|nr:HAMP domain-containing sensor histidine kinase [Taibaiella sp. KBW10]RQO31997.1 two-component sensor histidine kinase [Taibaiella sp. KBW10]